MFHLAAAIPDMAMIAPAAPTEAAETVAGVLLLLCYLWWSQDWWLLSLAIPVCLALVVQYVPCSAIPDLTSSGGLDLSGPTSFCLHESLLVKS